MRYSLLPLYRVFTKSVDDTYLKEIMLIGANIEQLQSTIIVLKQGQTMLQAAFSSAAQAMQNLQSEAWAGQNRQQAEAVWERIQAQFAPTLNELEHIIVRTERFVNNLNEAGRSFYHPAQLDQNNYRDDTSDIELPEKEGYLDIHDGGNQSSPDSNDLLEQLFNLEFPWWLDVPLSFFVVGDIIDLFRELVKKRLEGKEPDNLITTIAVFGIVADLGWLLPLPLPDDAPNAILAVLKPIAKRLPAGEARDYLTKLIEDAVKNPDALKHLLEISTAFSKNPHILEKSMNSPRVMMGILESGGEFVELLARHGDAAFEAAQVLGKDAPIVLKQYDEIAHIPGAQRLLADVKAGGTITVGAVGEIHYFHSIRDDIVAVALRSDDGQKAADAILKDGTVVDVKNWDFQKDFYQHPSNIDKAIDKILTQVELRRAQYPGQPIKYVFTSPLEQVPAPIKEALIEEGVLIEGMP